MLLPALLSALGLCAAPAPSPGPSPLPADSLLRRELDSLVDAIFPRGAQFAAAAVRVRDSALVWGRLPYSRQMPASTQKVYTTEAALRVLGPKFRFTTALYGRGTAKGSEWIGDLVLVGSGDPTLGLDWGPSFTPLVNALHKRGIRKVTGKLVALDSLCGTAPWGIWPPDWTFGNARDNYGAPVAGLNWNLNRDNWRPSQEPRLLALRFLRQNLTKKGILVSGEDSVLTREDSLFAVPKDWTLLGQVSSPALESMLRPFLWESVNQIGEALVLRMGAGFGKKSEEPREAGMRRMRLNLQAAGVRIWENELRDGSGLSRYDAVPPIDMARLLARSARDSGSARTVDFLAAGGQGTLRRRFRSLPDPAWVLAKTGTLDRVSNLCGIIRSPRTDTIAFALFCQNYNTGAASMRKLQDKVVSLLAGVPIRKLAEEDDDDSLNVPKGPYWPTVEILPDFPSWRDYRF